jgi:hypothetical protein
MAALTAERNTPHMALDGLTRSAQDYPVNGGSTLWKGGIGCLQDSDGHAVPGATATNLRCAGRVEETIVNSGADGAKRVHIREGTFKWANATAGDAIVQSDVGDYAYIVDDQTVARLSATEARSPAGIIRQVDSDGVWVESSLAISEVGLIELAAAVIP